MIARRMVAWRWLLAAGWTALACGGAERGQERASGREDGPEGRVPVMLFLGNSLTAGLGVDPAEAFPALIEARLDSAGFDYRVVNGGVSGETSAGGLRRLDWLLRQPVGVLLLELGANDALRGQDLTATRENLQAIISQTRAAHPEALIVLLGMQAPPNMGRDYTEGFARIFPELAAANGTELVPFLLEGVGGIPELNQRDGIHPTPEGHAIMAETVWGVLEPALRRVAARAVAQNSRAR